MSGRTKGRMVVAALAVCMTAACTKKTGADPVVTPPPAGDRAAIAASPELQGQWQSKCADGRYFGVTERSRLVIDGARLAQSTIVTKRGDCSGGDVEIMMTGFLAKLAKKEGASASGTPIDIEVGSYRVKPVTEFGERILELANWCGISDWTIGQEREVTSAVGSGGCFPTARIHSIYSLESSGAESRLFFGAGEHAATPAKRPTEVDKEAYFEKI